MSTKTKIKIIAALIEFSGVGALVLLQTLMGWPRWVAVLLIFSDSASHGARQIRELANDNGRQY